MGRTIAVIDLAHCGTTMAAGVLERLGVPMVWSRGKRHKLEDADVVEALTGKTSFSQLVEGRQGVTWGFKYPGAWKFADVLSILEYPVYLAIYKDPVSVTLRRFGTISGGKLARTVRWMSESIEGINASGLSVHWLSYYKALAKPGKFAERLAHLADVSMTAGQMDAILEWMFPLRRV